MTVPTAGELQEAYNQATQNQDDLNSSVSNSNSILDNLGNFAKKAEDAIKHFGDVVAKQPELFTTLGGALIHAQDALEGLSHVDINTFSDQYKDLQALLSKTPASEATTAIFSKLGSAFVASGGSASIFTNALKTSTTAVFDLMRGMTEHADRALASENSMLAYVAANGELNEVLSKVGTNLEYLNPLMDANNTIISKSKDATNSNQRQIDTYVAALSTVPGALHQIISAGTGVNDNMSMLTATVKLAHGTFRDVGAVTGDLRQAFIDFNLTGEDSLKFVSRMSELTNNLSNNNKGIKVTFDEMHKGLVATTQAFKDITSAGEASGKMTESISELMNDYASRLIQTGVSGRQAIEIAQQMTSTLGGLTIQQKAFLSAQTGGPGGLMGGFQIEKMLKEGDIAGVQKKVEETLKKQFGGRIVTLEDATKSQAAASQLEKQTLLLRQGPLGNFAKTDQDAYRIFEAMKSGKTFEGEKGLSKTGLKENINRGTKIEDRSRTVISAIGSDVSAIRKSLETTSLNTLQKTLTNAELPDVVGRARNQNAQAQYLKNRSADASRVGISEGTLKNVSGQNLIDKSDERRRNVLGNAATTIKEGIPAVAKSSTDTFDGIVSSLLSLASSKNKYNNVSLKDEISAKRQQNEEHKLVEVATKKEQSRTQLLPSARVNVAVVSTPQTVKEAVNAAKIPQTQQRGTTPITIHEESSHGIKLTVKAEYINKENQSNQSKAINPAPNQ